LANLKGDSGKKKPTVAEAGGGRKTSETAFLNCRSCSDWGRAGRGNEKAEVNEGWGASVGISNTNMMTFFLIQLFVRVGKKGRS